MRLLGIAVFDNRIVLSATPSIIVYTDVDRNTVFDPMVDKREVFLTGFQNKNHDHTVHAVVGFKRTMAFFLRELRGRSQNQGRPALPCRLLLRIPRGDRKEKLGRGSLRGGMTMRINPDGTGLTPTGENMRTRMICSSPRMGISCKATTMIPPIPVPLGLWNTPIWGMRILRMEAAPGKRSPRPGKSHRVGTRALGSPVLTGGKTIRGLPSGVDLRRRFAYRKRIHRG